MEKITLISLIKHPPRVCTENVGLFPSVMNLCVARQNTHCGCVFLRSLLVGFLRSRLLEGYLKLVHTESGYL